MRDGGGPPERQSSPMKVRELLARLRDTDPDFLVVIDANSQSLIVVNPKPGFCSQAELEEDEGRSLPEQDQKFLRDLRIKY